MEPVSQLLVIGWIVLHVAALASACITRIAVGSCVETLAQICFYAAMAAIGVAMWISQQLEVGWTWSAITFMAMVLTAVIDFRRVNEPARASLHR